MKTKILSLIAILLIAATCTNAQITQGKYLLGGSVSYSSNQPIPSNGTPTQQIFNSNIQIGKAVKENTVAGLILSYYSNNGGGAYKANGYGAGVFYRKYKPLTKGLYFFGEADALYNYSRNTQGKFEIGSEGTRNTTNGAMLSFVPGLSYAVWKKLQMELSMPYLLTISYGRGKTETTSTGIQQVTTSKTNSFGANASLNANILNNFAIGFKFLLGN